MQRRSSGCAGRLSLWNRRTWIRDPQLVQRKRTGQPPVLLNRLLIPLHWLREPLAERAQLREFELTQLRVPLFEICHGRVEPFLLMFREGPDDATAHNVLKKLIARFV